MTIRTRVRRRRRWLVAAALVLSTGCGVRAASAGAADPAVASPSPSPADGVELYPAALLRHLGDSLGRAAATAHMLGSHDGYQYLQIRRASSGVPEVHDRWIDVAVVQAGRATLLSGGTVTGGRVESPGEQRGGTIAGGRSRAVGAGDLVIIPAGIPHQFEIAPGDSLRYLATKILDRSSHR